MRDFRRPYAANTASTRPALTCCFSAPTTRKITQARDICAIRGIKSGIASVAVETLITGGYMQRENDSSDRRIRRLVPTEKAAPIITEGRDMQSRFAVMLRSGITQEELASFERMTDKLEENIRLFEQGESGDV